MTAADVQFAVARRGYDRTQVDAHITMLVERLRATEFARASAAAEVETLTGRLEVTRTELDAARTENRKRRVEVDELRAHVAELSTVPHTVDGMSERLQQMVRVAQDEVNDMRSRATASASHILALAQAEADELHERSSKERQEFEAERNAMQEALTIQMEEGRARLEQVRSESDGQRARLDAELAERRADTERALAREIQDRRAAMAAELSAEEAARRDDAGRLLETAGQQAKNQLAEADAEAQRMRAEARRDVSVAQRELEDLRHLQHQVSEQLTSVRALLDWTLPNMATGNTAPAKVVAGNGDVPMVLVPARPPALDGPAAAAEATIEPPAGGPARKAPSPGPNAVARPRREADGGAMRRDVGNPA